MINNENQVDYDAMPEDEFADKMRENLLSDTESLSHELLQDIDKAILEDGRTRRAALATLTMTYKELESKVMEDRELALAMAELSECLNTELYRHTADLIDKAKIHIMFALAGREDMTNLFDEVKETA